MTNTELQEKIARLEAELAEVKEKVEALPKRVGGVFKPEYGEEYWYISAEGTTFVDNWGGDSIECAQYAIGNCFPTEQAAEDTVRVLKLIQKARESQNGFVPDWENSTQHKYFLYFHMGDIGVADYPSINVAPTFGFWEDNKSVCEQFIDENREEILWYFTEYER